MALPIIITITRQPLKAAHRQKVVQQLQLRLRPRVAAQLQLLQPRNASRYNC